MFFVRILQIELLLSCAEGLTDARGQVWNPQSATSNLLEESFWSVMKRRRRVIVAVKQGAYSLQSFADFAHGGSGKFPK